MAKGWTYVLLTGCLLGGYASAVAQPMPAPMIGVGPPPLESLPTTRPPIGRQGAPVLPVPVMAPCAGVPCPAPACPDVPPPPIGPSCDTSPIFTVGFEYLYWFTQKQKLPPLVTSGSINDAIPGALGQPGTTVLLQGTDGDVNRHSGGRLTFGVGLDRDCDWSVDANFFLLEQQTGSRTFTGTGAAGISVLARPFFNVNAGVEDSDPVAVPNVSSGSITIDTPRQLYGGDANLRNLRFTSENSRLYLLAGGRFLSLNEGLHITQNSQDLPGLGVPGNNLFVSERTDTQNRFYGGQVGAAYEFRLGPVILTSTGKVAAGVVQQKITNSPLSILTDPINGVTTDTNNSLYIYPNNNGKFSRTAFAVVPEGNFKLGFDFNQYVRFTVGYTFLYLSQAARPGDQVNRNVNLQPLGVPAVISPAASPPAFQSTGFWAQGFDVGLRFSF